MLPLFLVLLVAAVVIWYFLTHPIVLTHRNLTEQKLEELLTALYYRGFDGGRLEVGAKGTAVRVITRKSVPAVNDVRLSIEIVGSSSLEPEKLSANGVSLFADDLCNGKVVPIGSDVATAERITSVVMSSVTHKPLADVGFARLVDVADGTRMVGWNDVGVQGLRDTRLR